MLHIDPENLAIVLDIPGRFNYTFYAYGSRVKGTQKKFSDLDLCIMESLSDLDLFSLREALENSNLPFKVDIRRFSDMSNDFQKIIQKDLVEIKKTKG